LSKIDRTSIKDQALEQIRRYILSGAVQPGQRLPSERDLAEQLGVGRNSVREALRVLETLGLIDIRIGDGTYLAQDTSSNIGRSIGLSLAVHGGTIVEIISARRMIEVAAVGVAAQEASAEEVQLLEQELERMEAQPADIREYLKADMMFHRLLGRMTHNPIVAHVIDSLITMLEVALKETQGDELKTSMEAMASHRDVYEAIKARNPAAASDAMDRHLHFSTELWQAIISLSAASQTPDSVNF
jgi:GntR family transcriptional repressor for pyruvate dehydrogenase complex